MLGRHAYNVDIVAELLGAFEQAVLLAVWKLQMTHMDAPFSAVLSPLWTARPPQGRSTQHWIAWNKRASLPHGWKQGRRSAQDVRGGITASRRPGVKALNESKAALEHMWRGAKWPLELKA